MRIEKDSQGLTIKSFLPSLSFTCSLPSFVGKSKTINNDDVTDIDIDIYLYLLILETRSYPNTHLFLVGLPLEMQFRQH